MLIPVHGESVQRSKPQMTLRFIKMFSVLLLAGLAPPPSQGPWDPLQGKEARKAGAAQLSVAASHKLRCIVSSSNTLIHLTAPAQSY